MTLGSLDRQASPADQGERQQKLDTFRDWYYEFDIGQAKTRAKSSDARVRHEGRKDYLFRPLLQLFGGTLAGKRVLDLGCNAGYFSLSALEARCDFVMGVESDQTYLDQAAIVFSELGIDPSRYRITKADIFDFLTTTDERFDIVFCLGLAHHLQSTRYFELFQRLAAINSDVLVVDTILSAFQCGPMLELYQKDAAHKQNPDGGVVIRPTPSGLLRLMSQYGYRGVALRPSSMVGETFRDYQSGSRRGFIFAKQRNLESLAKASDDFDRFTLHGVPKGVLVRELMSRGISKLKRLGLGCVK